MPDQSGICLFLITDNTTHMHTNNLTAVEQGFNTDSNELRKLKYDNDHSNNSADLTVAAAWYVMDFNELMKKIVTKYHNELKDQAVVIYDLSNRLFRTDGYLYPNLSKVVELLYVFFHDLFYQFRKEEQILFQNIAQLTEKRLHERAFDHSTFGLVTEHVHELKKRHHEMFQNLMELGELTGGYRIIEGDCRSYMKLMEMMKEFEAQLIEHIRVEQDVLIPRVVLLDEK